MRYEKFQNSVQCGTYNVAILAAIDLHLQCINKHIYKICAVNSFSIVDTNVSGTDTTQRINPS
jgi:hypothetical protein